MIMRASMVSSRSKPRDFESLGAVTALHFGTRPEPRRRQPAHPAEGTWQA